MVRSSTGPGDPDLPAIERKIQSADDHPRNRQNGWGDVRIDQLIQIMEQEPTLVWLDSSFGFEPVLQHGQRTRPRKQLREDPPDKRSDMQPPENRARACQQGTGDYPQNEQRMQEEDGSSECRIETRARTAACISGIYTVRYSLACERFLRSTWHGERRIRPRCQARNAGCLSVHANQRRSDRHPTRLRNR